MGVNDVRRHLLLRESVLALILFVVKITLELQYPPQYPDVLPELSLYPIEGAGEIEDSEISDLLKDLRAVARALFPILNCTSIINY
jgi:hypothetical protein